jgi:hypothetical protein
MVQFAGTTYRITERPSSYEIVRVLDDQCVGVFRRWPMLQVLECSIEPQLLLGVIREAVQAAKLSCRPDRRSSALERLPTLLFRSISHARRFLVRQLLTGADAAVRLLTSHTVQVRRLS